MRRAVSARIVLIDQSDAGSYPAAASSVSESGLAGAHGDGVITVVLTR